MQVVCGVPAAITIDAAEGLRRVCPIRVARARRAAARVPSAGWSHFSATWRAKHTKTRVAAARAAKRWLAIRI